MPAPRLLPLTIAAMIALLSVKTVALVRSALADDAITTAPSATAEPAKRERVHAPATGGGVNAAAPGVLRPGAAAGAAVAKAVPEPAPVSDSERALLLDLRARRSELDAREAALQSREQVLAAAEHRIAARVDELTGLQGRIEALEKAREQREAANWQGLVKLYEGMKPRDAAAIFNDLDMPVLLEVIDRMKESKAAPILAAMQPERARQVTADLAQKRLRTTAVSEPGAAASSAPSAHGG
jgi:flagellar motility protein MotE (MotC chaperone)